jgi:alpha-glucosidase (family GH31 glycosyl hydrolase)
VAPVAAARFEYLFGPDLLVAPVVDLGATGRDVWLPPGRRVDFWAAVAYDPTTGSYDLRPGPAPVRTGDQVVHVASPLGRPPLFVRAGTCLPLLPADVDTLDDTVDDRPGGHGDRVVTLAEGAGRTRHLGFGTSCR